MKLQTLDELKDRFYGPKGSEKRDQLDRELDVLRIGILIRNARKESNLTQAELAERIGKKRAFISRVENDGSNLTIATLLDIVEKGLGKKLSFDIQ
jgi:putative DNA-binding protein